MNQFNLASYNLPTKIYLSLLALCSVGLFVFSSFDFKSFSMLQFAVLGVMIIVSLIACQHQPKIPKLKWNISANEFIILWAIIWLGVSGSVILSLSCSLATFWLFTKDKNHWLINIFCNVISTFLAASAFYLFLQNVAGIENIINVSNLVGILWLIAAVGITAFTHFATYTVLYSIFIKLENDEYANETLSHTVKTTSTSYLLGIVGALILHLAFAHFGETFSIVLLISAISGYLFYRLHLQRLEIKTKEISESSRIHLATVEALATAIDARDQVGIGHVRRTQIYAVGMGEILKLSDDEIQSLTAGALLHDIGKLGVPDHILNKPGRLTPAEMEKMKIHSTVGAAILEKIDFPYPVVETVKYHHECWDGSGYPERLKGDKIPLTARIISVADAYDTLRGARPYRDPVSREDARKLLLKGSGSQFDPKLVDIFLRNLRHFETEIKREGLGYELDSQVPDLFVGEDGGLSEANHGYVEHIQRANREVFALYELARVFSASLNLQDTVSLFVNKIRELMPFETCIVYLLDKTQGFAEAIHVEGQNADFLKGKQIKAGEGATGYVLKKRQAVYNINPALDFSFHQAESIQNYKAMASLPLIANETLIGAVSLYSCELENYEDEHMRLLETVSRIASDAILKSVRHAETETHALTDPMTNLPNARCLQLNFDNEVSRAARNNSEFQLIMLDLDGFKAVNDTYGHKIGDLLLREIGKVMREQLREHDFLARYAGDEFVALIPDTSNEGIQELCQRLEKSISGFKLPVGNGEFTGVGVSIGSAGYPKNGNNLDQIISLADKNMYSVKAKHKRQRNNIPISASPTNQLITKQVTENPANHQIANNNQMANAPIINASTIDFSKEVSFKNLREDNETLILNDDSLMIEDDSFIVELDESHIVSSNTIN